jgi:hypothetical protein
MESANCIRCQQRFDSRSKSRPYCSDVCKLAGNSSTVRSSQPRHRSADAKPLNALHYYFQCGNCPSGTVELRPKGLGLVEGAGGGFVGGALLGVLSGGFLAPLGALAGAAIAGGGKRYNHDSTCDSCGAVYDYTNAKLLREKAMPKRLR